MLQLSIITVCYNSEKTIESTIQSVIKQSYKNIEYIIVDGKSSDSTISIIEKYREHITHFVSEKDNGIYDAINKGIAMASGDVIGILNSDDFYIDNDVLSKVMHQFEEKQTDAVYCDLQYVDADNTNKIKRNWVAGKYKEGLFLKGWMPPHPSFFVKNKCYDLYGNFNITFRSAGDYELLLRFIHVHKISLSYLPIVAVKMRAGGISNANLWNRIKFNREDAKAWEVNNIKPGIFTLLRKPFSKIFQFLG